MSAKTKEILISTLESRFEKLHDVAILTEDCLNAVDFLADKLQTFDISAEQKNAIAELSGAVELWNDKFTTLAEKMQSVESQYYDNLSADKSKCALIYEVPSYAKKDIPNVSNLLEKFYMVGYYEVDDDDEDIIYTVESILKYMQEFYADFDMCIKALVNASYDGIWKDVEVVVSDINESIPNYNIKKVFELFDVKC